MWFLIVGAARYRTYSNFQSVSISLKHIVLVTNILFTPKKLVFLPNIIILILSKYYRQIFIDEISLLVKILNKLFATIQRNIGDLGTFPAPPTPFLVRVCNLLPPSPAAPPPQKMPGASLFSIRACPCRRPSVGNRKLEACPPSKALVIYGVFCLSRSKASCFTVFRALRFPRISSWRYETRILRGLGVHGTQKNDVLKVF